MRFLLLLLQAARVKTLPVGLTPVAMSAGWVFHQKGFLRLDVLCLTALSALSLQIAVNFFNDAFDVQLSQFKHLRKGPPRLTPTGKLTFSMIRNLGFGFIFLSCLFALPLIYRGGWP